jgi:hypothetical protein
LLKRLRRAEETAIFRLASTTHNFTVRGPHGSFLRWRGRVGKGPGNGVGEAPQFRQSGESLSPGTEHLFGGDVPF